MQPRDLAGVRQVRRADVYKAGRKAAVLERTEAGVRFRYAEEYLDAGLPAVATTLPLTDGATLTGAGAVPAFFAGLLPEGRRLSSLRRAVKTSADDELSLLLAVGRDPVGDVQVVPAGEAPRPAEPLIEVDRSFDEVRFSDLLEAAGVVDPVALAGVQDKASARMLSLPVAQASERYILKVDPPEYPHVVENEAYFLQVARRSRIAVSSARVVHDVTGRPGLLVRRFDRGVDADGLPISHAVEDAAQLLGIYPADKYNVTAERLVDSVADVCAARAVAALTLFRQLVLAWVTGNGDLHAKNVSVFSTAGEWRVAPVYDVASTLFYGDATFALSVGGRRSGLSRKQLVSFAVQRGLTETAAARVLDEVLRSTENVEQELLDGVLPFPDRAVRDVVRQLHRGRRDLSASAPRLD